jgi:hypothetical protein
MKMKMPTFINPLHCHSLCLIHNREKSEGWQFLKIHQLTNYQKIKYFYISD